ncbi:hypothetical protein [Bacteroides sp.]|uniref:hypothetical protein n=1 Tax=Bacteroides sp. TaxID=29523 RepID=UPI0025BE171D|nr:hypothetical protein [Bacteroides sp.]
MKEKNTDQKETALTAQEEDFCNLYIYGDMDFAGQHRKCYEEIFGETGNVAVASRRLLGKPQIMARIKELSALVQNDTETLAVKLQVAETLKAVMEETSSAAYSDKFGVSLSPAPLRAVSVNAAKALMDLYPIKHAQEAKLRIEGEGGVVFNVIVPEAKPRDHEET